MSTKKESNVPPLTTDNADEAVLAGWDPYVFSIISNRKNSYKEDRRSKPRSVAATRRRALLIAKAKREH